LTGAAWGECPKCAELIKMPGMGTITDPYLLPRHRCRSGWLGMVKIVLGRPKTGPKVTIKRQKG